MIFQDMMSGPKLQQRIFHFNPFILSTNRNGTLFRRTTNGNISSNFKRPGKDSILFNIQQLLQFSGTITLCTNIRLDDIFHCNFTIIILVKFGIVSEHFCFQIIIIIIATIIVVSYSSTTSLPRPSSRIQRTHLGTNLCNPMITLLMIKFPLSRSQLPRCITTFKLLTTKCQIDPPLFHITLLWYRVEIFILTYILHEDDTPIGHFDTCSVTNSISFGTD
mmetsp:Transcript_9744/g.19723  ORF Transcript_9744/g.19723 Transcript_9744/m.19723 type:complete len:220 (-) Transcript_9744:581-1240(-)